VRWVADLQDSALRSFARIIYFCPGIYPEHQNWERIFPKSSLNIAISLRSVNYKLAGPKFEIDLGFQWISLTSFHSDLALCFLGETWWSR
jgi:hypothetical protein